MYFMFLNIVISWFPQTYEKIKLFEKDLSGYQYLCSMEKALIIRRFSLLVVLSLLLTTNSVAQSPSGYIKFAMSYAETGLSNEELAMMPEETEMWFKGDLVKFRMPMGMGMQSDVLILKDRVVLLMDLMGNKLAMETAKSDVEKQNNATNKVTVRTIDGELKIIAGYNCKKAILSTPGEKDMIVWYTDKVKSNGSWYFKMSEINGFPLEFSMKTGDMSVRMSAKEVRMEEVGDVEFKVSPEYKVMSQEDMMKMMGGSR